MQRTTMGIKVDTKTMLSKQLKESINGIMANRNMKPAELSEVLDGLIIQGMENQQTLVRCIQTARQMRNEGVFLK